MTSANPESLTYARDLERDIRNYEHDGKCGRLELLMLIEKRHGLRGANPQDVLAELKRRHIKAVKNHLNAS